MTFSIFLPRHPIRFNAETAEKKFRRSCGNTTMFQMTGSRIIGLYVLMTWVFDRFTAVPYLRFLGEPEQGRLDSCKPHRLSATKAPL